MKTIILILLIVFPNLLKSQLVNDFRVNTDTNLSVPKYFAKVSSNTKGNSVVVWENNNSPIDIYAQIFDSSFNRVGNNFKVSTLSGSMNADVVVRKDGSFGVVWKAISVSPSGSLILLKIFNKYGAPVTQEIQINDTIKGFDPNIRIGTDNLNRFIITFDYSASVSYLKDIFYQIVDSNGIKVGNNIKVNQFSGLGRPALSVQKNGGFLISWEGYNSPVPRYDLFCQMYSANGSPIGNNQQVNDIESDIDTLNNQDFCDIATDSSGNFIIAFSETPYSTGVDRIRYQRFNYSGTKIGSNKTVGLFESAYISSDDVGNLIFLLSSSGSSIDYINDLRIDKNDNIIGGYFPVTNQFPNSSKGGSDVLLINNKIVNVWRDYRLSNQPQIFLNVRSYPNPDSVVSVSNISTEIPTKYTLHQNYPNPFNSVTKIKFNVAIFGDIKVKIYDALGREVQTLVNESLEPGTYETSFDGSMLNSGVYFYRIIAGEFTETKKMLLIK
ncbi:MAG: T9SS type A sorting domain-containing protein [Ignavibacteriae bacterium]|nr:T9SS type A sorting domain-containing protein [Ignavibacteriota bacterium]